MAGALDISSRIISLYNRFYTKITIIHAGSSLKLLGTTMDQGTRTYSSSKKPLTQNSVNSIKIDAGYLSLKFHRLMKTL